MQAGWVAGLHPASTGAACTDAGICGGPRVAAYFLRALRLPARVRERAGLAPRLGRHLLLAWAQAVRRRAGSLCPLRRLRRPM